jgi:hypothetical protein
MANRTVTDSAGRTWTCSATAGAQKGDSQMGRDVVLSCSTPSLTAPIDVTVGWQWEKMAPAGLARMINSVSPVPRA